MTATPPRFPAKEIAFQAGVSLATVDRVLHGRAGVRAVTRARVTAAVAELERQFHASGLAGRRLAVDVVIEAPRRFSDAVRAAFEAELPGMRPASFAARFHLAEMMRPGDLAAILRAIRRRGSHGVVLKAQATADTAALAAGLLSAGIPVVTYATDIAPEARLAYVGIDNATAGATAAYLLGSMLGDMRGRVLVTLSSARFSGEEERAEAFRRVLGERRPDLATVTVSEGMGVDRSTGTLVAAALRADPGIVAVYSCGGGNRAILEAFAVEGRPCRVFAAHDLDAANRRLLAEGRLSFVIHHDFRADARTACQIFLHHHRMLPDDFRPAPARILIATPYDSG